MSHDQHIGDNRVPYKDAGAAHRDVIWRANALRPRLSGRRRAVLEAVLVQTVSYSKLEDWTSVRQIARVVFGGTEPDGRDRAWVADELVVLHDLGLIEVESNGRRGRAARIKVSVWDSMAAEATSISDTIGRDDDGHSGGGVEVMAGASGVNGRAFGPNGRDLVTGTAADIAAHLEVPRNQFREINPRRAEARVFESVEMCADCLDKFGVEVLATECDAATHRQTFVKQRVAS